MEQTSADLSKAIEEAQETIATLTEELDALAKDIQKLDNDVAEATRLRRDEHAEFTDTTAANNAAKELIGIAKNRMRKFYQPKLYKAPPKLELTREDLHLACDWLLSNFDSRKAARAGEVDSLKKAKAVLSGADYSLVQKTKHHATLRR